jgi:hypothetical protein
MNSISLVEADGSDPLSICRANRDWLVSRYKLEAIIALKFFTDAMPLTESDRATDDKAIEHIRKCPKCREWIHRIIPKDILRRQQRLTHYCCAGMFVAIEEANGKAKNKITFELFRGEDPCWMIDGIRSFISYCPWCGKKLPQKPFIKE